jgi:hypothetical protein
MLKKSLTSLDTSKYKKLKDDKYWETFIRSLRIKLTAHGFQNVMDPNFKPDNEPIKQKLFRLKSTFVYSILDDIIDSDMGKTIVRKYTDTMDGQKAFAELVDYYNQSIQAELSSSDILDYLVTARFNRTWKGSAQQFILHWTNQLRVLDAMSPATERISSDLRLRLLQNSVEDVEELSTVHNQSQFEVAKGGTKLTFDKYLPLLNTAAVRYDKRHARNKRQAADLRRALVHDVDYGQDIVGYEQDEFYDAQDEQNGEFYCDIDTAPDAYFAINNVSTSSARRSYDVNESKSRHDNTSRSDASGLTRPNLPYPIYKRLSPESQAVLNEYPMEPRRNGPRPKGTLPRRPPNRKPGASPTT